jgi:SAM-dependent methyltransferase
VRLMTFDTVAFEMVDKTISNQDSMFKGFHEHYFYVGNSALKCINSAIKISEKDPSGIKKILDLPSGYGRVLRWIRAEFPNAEISACDLDIGGVNFCAEQFGAKPVYSDKDPQKIICGDTFDLIWCGSLFTHLDSDHWVQFLKLFDSLLNPDGLLLFTTHGPYVVYRGQKGFDYGLKPKPLRKIVSKYEGSGFGYINYDNNQGYGISVAKPWYVIKLLESVPKLKLLYYKEKGWDHHQDVVAYFKDSHFNDFCFDYKNIFSE